MKTLDIAFNLFRHYAKTEEINNYYGLLAIYGLTQAVCESGDEIAAELCKTILNRYPDQVTHPCYNFVCYRAGGNGKAWAIMKGMIPDSGEMLKPYADQTLRAAADSEGILCMPGMEEQGAIWIDTAAAVVPFMLFAGIRYQDDCYINFAAEQGIRMYETLLDRSCGLLHQCRGFLPDKERFSGDHWSRGNGWGYLALAELVTYLPADSKYRERALNCYLDMTASLLPFQTEKGLWRQEIPEPLSWEESSGSALILYGLGAGIRQGLFADGREKECFEKGINGLLTWCVNADFSTERSCPGCLCPGEGEKKGTVQAYITEKLPVHDEHHSFGAIMLALTEAYRNGMKEFSWSGKR